VGFVVVFSFLYQVACVVLRELEAAQRIVTVSRCDTVRVSLRNHSDQGIIGVNGYERAAR